MLYYVDQSFFFCLFYLAFFSLLMQIVMIFQSAPPWHITVFQFILVEALSVWSQVIWPLWNSFVNDLSYGSNVLLISTNLLPVLHKFQLQLGHFENKVKFACVCQCCLAPVEQRTAMCLAAKIYEYFKMLFSPAFHHRQCWSQ